MMNERIGEPQFGEPVNPDDVVTRITGRPPFDVGSVGSAAEAATYYYGRWNALLCAFNLVGELLDQPAKEVLYDRLVDCISLAKRCKPQDPHVVEAGNYFELLAIAVNMALEDF